MPTVRSVTTSLHCLRSWSRWVWLLVADWIIHCICAVVSVLVFLFNVVFLRFGYNAKFYGVRASNVAMLPASAVADCETLLL